MSAEPRLPALAYQPPVGPAGLPPLRRTARRRPCHRSTADSRSNLGAVRRAVGGRCRSRSTRAADVDRGRAGAPADLTIIDPSLAPRMRACTCCPAGWAGGSRHARRYGIDGAHCDIGRHREITTRASALGVGHADLARRLRRATAPPCRLAVPPLCVRPRKEDAVIRRWRRHHIIFECSCGC